MYNNDFEFLFQISLLYYLGSSVILILWVIINPTFLRFHENLEINIKSTLETAIIFALLSHKLLYWYIYNSTLGRHYQILQRSFFGPSESYLDGSICFSLNIPNSKGQQEYLSANLRFLQEDQSVLNLIFPIQNEESVPFRLS